MSESGQREEGPGRSGVCEDDGRVEMEAGAAEGKSDMDRSNWQCGRLAGSSRRSIKRLDGSSEERAMTEGSSKKQCRKPATSGRPGRKNEMHDFDVFFCGRQKGFSSRRKECCVALGVP